MNPGVLHLKHLPSLTVGHLTLWLQSFFATLELAWRLFLQTLTWHGLLFSMFTIWYGLFSLLLMFPKMRIEAPPPSTVQGKYIYTLFKAENQTIQLPLLCTKPSKDKCKFLSFRGR